MTYDTRISAIGNFLILLGDADGSDPESVFFFVAEQFSDEEIDKVLDDLKARFLKQKRVRCKFYVPHSFN